jgi:hypothetical protein
LYISVGILFSVVAIAMILNLVMPIALSCETKNPNWLFLYVAEPILLFLDVYLFNLLDDLEWWI